jgi:transcription initiation factor TFIIIB Brf1 subunit/transcription initiation factor TFIIB
MDICTICNDGENIVFDKSNGNYVCTECGYVLEEYIENMSDSRVYDEDNEPVYNKKDKLFFDSCYEKFSYHIIDYAYSTLKKILRTKILRGKNRYGMYGACIYIACNDFDVYRTVGEISSSINVQSNVIHKMLRKYCKYHIKHQCDDSMNISLINRYITKLQINEKNNKRKLRTYTIKITNFVYKYELLWGKKRSSVIASILYWILGDTQIQYIDKKILSVVLDCSIVTINKFTKILISHQTILRKVMNT